MRYDPLVDEEYRAVARAIKFVNLKKPKDPREQTRWAERIRGFTGVAPSNARISINLKGRVVARDKSALSSLIASRCQIKLRMALDALCRPTVQRPSHLTARRTTVRDGKKHVTHKIDLRTLPEVWVRHVVYDNRLIAKAQQPITPTLESFVAYSSALLATQRWRKKLAKCVVCDKFFIALPRRGGPNPKTCGPACAEINERTVNAKRQQRSRDQRSAGRAGHAKRNCKKEVPTVLIRGII